MQAVMIRNTALAANMKPTAASVAAYYPPAVENG